MGKCVKLEAQDIDSIEEISGHFIDSKLQGEVHVGLKNGTHIKLTLNQEGTICGVQKHFNENNELIQTSFWPKTRDLWQKLTLQWFHLHRRSNGDMHLLSDRSFEKVISCKNVNMQFQIGYECFEVAEKYMENHNGFIEVANEAHLLPEDNKFFNLNLTSIEKMFLDEAELYPKKKCQESSKDVFSWLEAMEYDFHARSHLKVHYIILITTSLLFLLLKLR